MLYVAFLYATSSLIFKGARVELYTLIVVVLFYSLTLNHKIAYELLKEQWRIVVLVVLFSFVAIYAMTILRGGGGVESFIEYHLVGFVLFSQLVDGLPPYLDLYYNFGISFFGGIDYFVSLIASYFFGWEDGLTRLSMKFENYIWSTKTYDSQIQGGLMVNYSASGHNAFFTIMASGYKGLGLYGVVILGLVLGLAIEYFFRRADKGCLHSEAIFILLLNAMVMGVFVSSLETIGFWISVITINIVMFFSRIR